MPLGGRAGRTSRGRLSGRLVLSEDWDSPEVNLLVAEQFGLAES